MAASTSGPSKTVRATTLRLRTCGGALATRESSAGTARSSPMAPSAATAASRTSRSECSWAASTSQSMADLSPISPNAVATASTTIGSGSAVAVISERRAGRPRRPSASAASARTRTSASSARSRCNSCRWSAPWEMEETARRRIAASSWSRCLEGSAMTALRRLSSTASRVPTAGGIARHGGLRRTVQFTNDRS